MNSAVTFTFLRHFIFCLLQLTRLAHSAFSPQRNWTRVQETKMTQNDGRANMHVDT